MKLRQDIVDLLHAGQSDAAISRTLHVCNRTVATARAALGLPKAQSGYAAATSLEAALMAHVEALADGHLRWKGHRNSTTVPCFRWQGRMWTAYRAAFEIQHGRKPVGKVTPGCGAPQCVAPGHVEDRPMREALAAQLASIFGSAA
jgi:hypothetical protein